MIIQTLEAWAIPLTRCERVSYSPSTTIESFISPHNHIKTSKFKIYRKVKEEVTKQERDSGDLVVAFNYWMNVLGVNQGS